MSTGRVGEKKSRKWMSSFIRKFKMYKRMACVTHKWYSLNTPDCANDDCFVITACSFVNYVNHTKRNHKLMGEIITEKNKHYHYDLYVFQELSVHGYDCQVSEVAEHEDGPSFQFFSNIAKSLEVGIIYGFAEKDYDGNYYCSAMFIGKDGRKLLCYRKTHFYKTEGKFGSFENIFTPGCAIGPVVEYCGLKLGIMICYDAEIPECSRVLSLRGAHVLITIASHPNDTEFKKTLASRSRENFIFSIAINDQKCGTSFVCTPRGVTRTATKITLHKSEMVYLNRKRREKLSLRRPELYHSLTEKKFESAE